MSDVQQGILLSLGSINADFQLRVDSMEDLGSSMRPGRDLLQLSGGKAANVAVLACRLGCTTQLLGRVGGDRLAQQALGPLRAEGVDITLVRHAQRENTGMALLAVAPDGSKRSVSAAEANFGFTSEDIDAVEAAIEAAPPGSVLAVDYEVTPRAIARAIAVARERGFPVVVDPSFPDFVERAEIPGVTVLTPNEREARALVGADEGMPLGQVACALAALGPQSVCIKLDQGGCLLYDGKLWHQHSAAVKVVDTSGAGDAFTGAIAVALLERQDIRNAVLLAGAATELAVTAYGAQPSYPTRESLQSQMLRTAQRPLCPWID